MKKNPFSGRKTETKWHLPVDYRILTREERYSVRNQYRQEQDDLCAYCQYPLTGVVAPKVQKKLVDTSRFPSGFFDYPVHLHHDHDTGLTIGAVHAYCNAVLWQFEGE